MLSTQRNRWRRDFQLTRCSARRRYDTLRLLLLLLCGSLVIVVLTRAPLSRAEQGPGFSALPGSLSVSIVNATHVVLVPRATFASTPQVQIYSFGQTPPGLMQPTVDALGNLWVGAMAANRLAQLHTLSTNQVVNDLRSEQKLPSNMRNCPQS